MSRSPIGVLAVLLCIASAPALLARGDVHVVDDDGGFDFNDIQLAVLNVADGDVLLVRDGVYGGFTINGKSLTIVADAGAQVTIDSTILVHNLAGSQSVVLRDLDVVDMFTGVALYDLRTSVGPMWMEECSAEGGAMFQVNHAAFVRCAFDSEVASSGLSSFASNVIVLDTTVQAGDGNDGFVDIKLGIPVNGFDGTGGYRTTAGDTVFISGGSMSGGDGGDGVEPAPPDGCSSGGDGGPGVAVFAADSVMRLQDVALAAGTGGVGGAGCNDGVAGVPIEVVLGGNPTTPIAGPYRALSANSPVREGETLTISFAGEPGDAAFLLYAFAQEHAFIPNFSGASLLDNFILFPIPFVLLGSGTFDLPVVVPELGPGTESISVFLGSFFVATDSAKFLGSSSAVLLLDDAF
jgi:hypothetical protein